MSKYTVETDHNGKGWSWIVGPEGYREGPIRYRWEAEEWAEEMNNGKPPPDYARAALAKGGGEMSDVEERLRGENWWLNVSGEEAADYIRTLHTHLNSRSDVNAELRAEIERLRARVAKLEAALQDKVEGRE